MTQAKQNIFARMRLAPSALRTVAARRFDDALALQRTGNNQRANGAMYLAGFVVECLLKAELLVSYPWLRSAASPANRSEEDRVLWSLCYRSHDLEEIVQRLPNVVEKLERKDQLYGPKPRIMLQQICAEWTIFARYSSRTATMGEASDFLEKVKEVKRCLS